MSTKINLVLIDDEKLIREGLKIMLSIFPDINVVATGDNGYEALEICKTNDVDVVLMDIRMPECNGVTGTKLIKEQFTNVKVLILTTFNDEEYIHEALNYGASGYLLKDSSHDVIYDGVKSAFAGNVVVHPEVLTTMISHGIPKPKEESKEDLLKDYDLTPREITIIEEIANGQSNKEIADKLFLSEGTVKNNITNVLLKLELRDRTQIAIFAYKTKLCQ